jgi:hypothetical protein
VWAPSLPLLHQREASGLAPNPVSQRTNRRRCSARPRSSHQRANGLTAAPGAEEPPSGWLATADADLRSLSYGHLVGDSTGPAWRSKQGRQQRKAPGRSRQLRSWRGGGRSRLGPSHLLRCGRGTQLGAATRSRSFRRSTVVGLKSRERRVSRLARCDTHCDGDHPVRRGGLAGWG